MTLDFEWDDRKAAVNERKHGVSFDEATSIFGDSRMKLHYDGEHSQNEDRFMAIGISDQGRWLIVSHVYRGKRVRIINARTASKSEELNYA